MGDTAICIHPEDERFTHLHGKRARVPMTDQEVPIILDEYVDREFERLLEGHPGARRQRLRSGQKHNLESINIFHLTAR